MAAGASTEWGGEVTGEAPRWAVPRLVAHGKKVPALGSPNGASCVFCVSVPRTREAVKVMSIGNGATVSRTRSDFPSSDQVVAGTAEVPVRPMEFSKWVADLPKYFAADGDMIMSHVLTVLSSTFPEGEKFFVRSVAAVRDELTDPQLRADVEGFIGQEEMHGREHQVLNDRLAEHGYPTRGIDSYVRGLYWVRERIQSKKVNLAFTAALEHYTATLAELLLTDEQARQAVGKPGARDILTWHALEESEHKAVAFDVYKAVGGGELMRIFVMFLTDLLFLLETSIMGVISLAMDRNTWRHPLT